MCVRLHLYLCLPDRCGQNIHKSKKDRRFLLVQFYTVCLLYSYVFSVRTGQAGRGINAPRLVLDTSRPDVIRQDCLEPLLNLTTCLHVITCREIRKIDQRLNIC